MKYYWLCLDSVFELVSGEDLARMDAAKMQGDIAKKQLEKTTSLKENELISISLRRDTPTSASTFTQLDAGSAPSTSAGVKLDGTATQLLPSGQPLWKSSSFVPFAKYPEKQKRYELYLETVKQGKTCKLHE